MNHLTFPSIVIVTGSISIGRDDFDCLATGCTSSKITFPYAFRDSKNWFVLCVFLSYMPIPLEGTVVGADVHTI
jgi:hypothetical protein